VRTRNLAFVVQWTKWRISYLSVPDHPVHRRYTLTPPIRLRSCLDSHSSSCRWFWRPQRRVFFFHGEGPRSRCYGRTTALRLFVQPCDEDEQFLLSSFTSNGAPVEWNGQGKADNSEKNLSQCHFIHHKPHMDWPGIEPGPPQWKAGD
jgi:hypothetical protein